MDEKVPKFYLKAVQIARARVLGAAKNINDADIARQFGLSSGGFQRLIATPEYQEIEAQVLATVAKKQDAMLDGNLSALIKQFQKIVPQAGQNIVDIAMQKRDLRVALEANKQLIELDPQRLLSKNGVRGDGQGAASTAALPAQVMDQLDADSAAVVDEVMGAPISNAVQ